MSNLSRIAQAVFAEPWLITPQQHAVIRRVVESHITGEAHMPDGCASLFDARDPDDGPGYEMRGNVALVPIMGTLGMRVGGLAKSSGMCDYLDVQAAIEDAAADENAEAIVLVIDSPGGTCTGTPETGALIALTNSAIPVIAFTDTGANSAAYWLASQCDAIVATESARVGSIGVYMALLDESAAYAQAGFKRELFASGKYKGMGVPGLPLSDAQRELLQREVDALFQEFRDVVLLTRPDVPDEAMQGQCFRAADALASGLIDQVGDLSAAIELAQERIEERNTR